MIKQERQREEKGEEREWGCEGGVGSVVFSKKCDRELDQYLEIFS